MKKIPKLVSSDVIYKDSHIQVHHDVLKVDSFSWNQVYLAWNNVDSVSVIPYENEGIYLVRQYRHASRDYFWQFPGGIMEKGMTTKEVAIKELKEETGLIAKKIIKIGQFSPEPGLISTRVQVFCATELTKSNKEPEKNEIGMQLKFFSITKLKEMIKTGKTQCGITLSAYQLLESYLSSKH